MDPYTHNTLQFPEVIVVEASAGSGKTYALAKRYLRLLINPQLKPGQTPLKNILAITFTNKATVEMKERILELLKKIALDAFADKGEEKDILELLAMDVRSVRKRAAQVMDEVMKDYNSFHIQTIDSFINALLLGCALQIDRSASFKIKRDYSEHLSYCLDLLIEQAAGNTEIREFFERFLQHYLFVENRNGWFPKEDILELMRSLFKLSNKYGGLFREYGVDSEDIIKKKVILSGRIKKIGKILPEGINKSAGRSILKFVNENKEILEIKNLPVKFQQREVPMNKGKSCRLEFEKEWGRIHESIKELVELEAKASYDPYVKLFNRLLVFFQSVSRKEDVLFLEELNRKARSLFGEDGLTVAEVYYRLATRFRHYLIDEFQDTSVLQWQNLVLMVEEALACGGSLFYVGDKKQAIYRFRGGEVRLFDQIKKEFAHFNVKPEQLNKNWRSQKAIVEFNNRVFSHDNLIDMFESSGIALELQDDRQAINEIVGIFKDAKQNYRKDYDSGYVQVELIDEKNQEERNQITREKVLNLLEELKERFNYEDIAVLTRDNKEVELVSSWLIEEGIPVESEKTLNVLECSLVKELLAFLRFLHSPIDDLSFAVFILGELFSRISGLSQEEVKAFLFSLRKQKKLTGGVRIYNLFREKYPQIWEDYIDKFFKSVGFISPYELVISIYRNFKLMKEFEDKQVFFIKLLELIKVKEDDCPGIGEFLAYLEKAQPEDLYVRVTHSNSLKVLTIHKSKGLEFPVVIVPFLRMEITPETGGKGTKSHVQEGINRDLGLVRITKYYLPYSRELKDIYIRDYKKACIDEFNGIYVALTRPQQELYVYIPQKSGNSKNKARFFIPEDMLRKGVQREYQEKRKGKDEPLIDIPAGIYRDWIVLLKDEFGDFSKFRNRDRILEGKVLHSMLSVIGNCFGEDTQKFLNEALENVRLQYPFIKDFSPYRQKIEELINKEKFRDIFFIEDGEVLCEKEVINRFGDTKRIDRLIVSEDKILVIDYKISSAVKEKHPGQVAEYMGIIKDIYPGQEVKGYLVYLDEMIIEEVKL